eukprot:scaffold22.g6132.t1
MQTVAAFTQQQRQARPSCTRVVAGGATALQAAARPQQPHPQSQQRRQPEQQLALPRRALLAGVPAAALAALLGAAQPAAATFVEPPPGYRFHEDKLDGYSFFYPEDWEPVTTSGNDVFYRNPFNIEENLFVDISSPSSSKFASVEDLGSPAAAAARTRDQARRTRGAGAAALGISFCPMHVPHACLQYLEEFMSTRLGVKRTAEVVSAAVRAGADGEEYYEIQTRVKSFASRNQLAVTQAEVDEAVELEFDRRYIAVLGVANKRLYQFRLQTTTAAFEADADRLLGVARSFKCRMLA